MKKEKYAIKGRHVCITGGSSGIGLALSAACVTSGARKVTILARDVHKLEESCKKLRALSDSCDISLQSCDITNSVAVCSAFDSIRRNCGAVDVLINCAGVSRPQTLDDLSTEECKMMIDINLLGGIYCTKQVIPDMKRNKAGVIVFINSQGGQVSFYGFAAYSASKFALRGLVEGLEMELKPFNIRVVQAFPPATITPGLEEENILKPKLSKDIEGTTSLWTASDVATIILRTIQSGNLVSTMGFIGYFLHQETAGFSAPSGVIDSIVQIVLGGFLRGVALLLRWSWERSVRAVYNVKASKTRIE